MLLAMASWRHIRFGFGACFSALLFSSAACERAEVSGGAWPTRFVEPRLVGEFSHAPCNPQDVDGRLIARPQCGAPPTARQVRALFSRWSKKQDDKTVEPAEALRHKASIRLMGSPLLDVDAVEGAIDLLEEAAKTAPENAAIYSDLAAALLVQAQERDEPADLIRALGAAAKACKADPALPAAAFNRALILQHLFLYEEARKAWTRYLAIDQYSAWAEEARQRRTTLMQPTQRALWHGARAAIEDAIARGDEDTVRDQVVIAPQAARETVLEEALPQWSQAILEGREEDANHFLQLARGLGRALATLDGDHSAQDAVAVIDRSAASAIRRTLLARGHHAYGESSALFGQLQIEDAAPRLLEARDFLTAAGSSAGAWAALAWGGAQLSQGEHADAAETFRAVAERYDTAAYPALQGRAHWGLGLIQERQGHYVAALGHYRAAADAFERIGERENLGAIYTLIAETLRFLGQHRSAWRHRYRSARALYRFPASRRLHNLLWDAADAALHEVGAEAALPLQDEGVAVAERLGNSLMLAEALLWRSKIHAARGDLEAAGADLRRAEGEGVHAASDTMRARLRSEIAYANATLRQETSPLEALPLFDEAVARYEENGLVLELATAYLSRAHARRSTGLQEAAAEDLEAAMALFEVQRAAVDDGGLRLTFTETAETLFDEAIGLAAARSDRAMVALELAERGRLVLQRGPQSAADGQQATWAATTPSGLAQLRRELTTLPAHVALIEYAWLEDQLLIWTAHGGDLALTRRRLGRAALADQLHNFLASVRAGEDGVPPAAATALYALLIPPAARELPPAVTFCFIPDKLLNALPFAALRNPESDRYLIEERTIAFAPSALHYLQAVKRQPPARGWAGALLVGDPAFDPALFEGLSRLPEASAEIAAIASLYPATSQVVLGAEATRPRFLATLDRWPVLHYAGHAVDDPRNPDFAHLVLAPSTAPVDAGMLFAHEIRTRRLQRLRLVVLSACDTIGAADSRVRGLSGLARSFLDAGVTAVVGSLWSVDDAVARRLLPDFHRRFLATGNAAEALRAAQRALLRSPQAAWKRPSAWAGFQVIGTMGEQ